MNNQMKYKQEENMLQLAVSPHPFSVERIDSSISVGLSLLEILESEQPDPVLFINAHIFINDSYIPRENWHLVYPKQGSIVQIRVVPMGGGGGKSPLRTVLSLAILASTSFIGGALAGTAFGQTSLFGITGSRLVSGALSFAGRLAMNSLAPPPRQRFNAPNQDNSTLFIQGARNEVKPFGGIPQVLGEHRLVPPMGARPYTEVIGNDQYLRMLFIWGYGPLDIRDLKIGETPIAEFEGVELENRQGFTNDEPLSLYSQSVLQNDLQVSLKQIDGYSLRTTDIDADEISVDITLPRGLMHLDGAGNRGIRTVNLEIQYALTGTSDWSAGVGSYKNIAEQTTSAFQVAGKRGNLSYKRIDLVVIDKATGVISIIKGERKIGVEPARPPMPDTKIKIAKAVHLGNTILSELIDERDLSLIGSVFENTGDFLPTIFGSKVKIATGGLQFLGVKITGKQSNALRHSVRFAVDKGQYDVRVQRITTDSTDNAVFDETVWSALRTIRHENPIAVTGLAMTALRIKATDQLNGVIDRFNGVVESIIPDWDGTGWTDSATSNPASLFRHVLQGSANARPLADNRIDISKLENWHDICENNGREFNSVIDYQASVRDILLDVAAAGRASPSVIDGKWGVITDNSQVAPIQHFTPRNSFDFEGERQFDDFPDALRVRFSNREQGWQQDEMLVFDDGYDENNAQNFEILELAGITNPEQVWKDGRYHIATARLRPETYSFSTDIEYIVCTRGDLIRFTHDVPLFGVQSARVKSIIDDTVNVISVDLDEVIEMQLDKNYSMRFRKSDGSSLVKDIVTVAGETQSFNFVTPLAIADSPAVGDLTMFGETGQESVELIVQSIRPSGDLSARLTCVDAAPEIHNADQGVTPDFNSNITLPIELQNLPAPVISDVQSGTEVMVKDGSGRFRPRIVINLAQTEISIDFDIKILIRDTEESSFNSAEFTQIRDNTISISGVETDQLYDIKLLYIGKNSWASKATMLANYRVIGSGGPPLDIENFRISILGDTAHLSWDKTADVDLSHYYIRYSSDVVGAVWESSVDLMTNISALTTSVSVPANTGTYLIKSVDSQTKHSINAAKIVSTIASLFTQNQVAIVDETPNFLGDKTNVFLVESSLRLMGQDSIDDWANIDNVERLDLGENGFHMSGSYNFETAFDLGAVYTSTLNASLDVTGVDLSMVIDQWNNSDSMENWDTSTASQVWGVVLELKTTQDNPLDIGAVWSEWNPFIIGDYTARGFDFRVSMSTTDIYVTPVISGLSVEIDMPDRVIGLEDITANAAGEALIFNKSFKNIPAIALSAQDMQTGDYYSVTNISSAGFEVRFFDSLGVGVSRTFDYVAKGYGQVF